MIAEWVLLTLFTSLSFECRTNSENNSRKKINMENNEAKK